MAIRTTRREFVKTSAALGAGFWAAGGVTPRRRRTALEEIRFACIGVGGKGSSDSEDAKNHGKVVAICDIDANTLGAAADKFPGAKHYYDFRKMLEELGDSIDAVTVSTPDHTHAVAALMAMRMGKHCFCQKPLTHSLQEARLMAQTAREKNLVTQMGNQGTALRTLRMSAALIRAGAIGRVKEVHVWTNRPVWPQGIGLQVKEVDPPPAEVKWDLWLGPAKWRPFSPEIHPFKWRGFWAFGTGALGDMACHTLNMAFMALNLKDPTSVVAQTAEHDNTVYPKWSVIDYQFPATAERPAVKMTWYDGGKMPPAELLEGCPRHPDSDRHYDSGALVVGEKGSFYSPGDYGGEVQNSGVIIDGEFTTQRRVDIPGLDFPRSPGHFTEFAEAIQGTGSTPMSNFPDYAGPLTETVLLGNLALWAGQEVKWDAQQQRVLSEQLSTDLEPLIRHEYLNGFTI